MNELITSTATISLAVGVYLGVLILFPKLVDKFTNKK